MTRFDVLSSVNCLATVKSVDIVVVILVGLVSWSILKQADCQTHHIPMRKPLCNNLMREVPAALLEGAGGHRMGPGQCDVTLVTPDRSRWMVKVDKVDILDCDVTVRIYDTHLSSHQAKSLVNLGCASPTPGIIYTNSSTLTIRLKHNNSTNYSFNIIATARRVSSKTDMSCSGFKCDSGECVAKSLMCDATDNCFDYSDESSNGTAHCDTSVWPFQGENWGVLASVLGVAAVLGITAACCRHIRNKNGSVDDLYDLNEGPYVHKYDTCTTREPMCDSDSTTTCTTTATKCLLPHSYPGV